MTFIRILNIFSNDTSRKANFLYNKNKKYISYLHIKVTFLTVNNKIIIGILIISILSIKI